METKSLCNGIMRGGGEQERTECLRHSRLRKTPIIDKKRASQSSKTMAFPMQIVK